MARENTPEEDQLIEDALLQIAGHVETIEGAKASIDGLVWLLRRPDEDGSCLATWRQVGEALGVTGQSAQERYAHLSWANRQTAEALTKPQRRRK